MTVTVYDVADYILSKSPGGMTAMKLQKLCYYSHAWHLVWNEEPLFPNRIEAWANGPVVRDLYRSHRQQFHLTGMPEHVHADKAKLSTEQRTSIDAVLEFYGPMSAHQLSQLTHQERPWMTAREGLAAGARSENQITDLAMASYYDSLTESADQTAAE